MFKIYVVPLTRMLADLYNMCAVCGGGEQYLQYVLWCYLWYFIDWDGKGNAFILYLRVSECRIARFKTSMVVEVKCYDEGVFLALQLQPLKWLERTNSFKIILRRAKWDILSDSPHLTFVQTIPHLYFSFSQLKHTLRHLVFTGIPHIVWYCSSPQKQKDKTPPHSLYFTFTVFSHYFYSSLQNWILFPCSRWVN